MVYLIGCAFGAEVQQEDEGHYHRAETGYGKDRDPPRGKLLGMGHGEHDESCRYDCDPGARQDPSGVVGSRQISRVRYTDHTPIREVYPVSPRIVPARHNVHFALTLEPVDSSCPDT